MCISFLQNKLLVQELQETHQSVFQILKDDNYSYKLAVELDEESVQSNWQVTVKNIGQIFSSKHDYFISILLVSQIRTKLDIKQSESEGKVTSQPSHLHKHPRVRHRSMDSRFRCHTDHRRHHCNSQCGKIDSRFRNILVRYIRRAFLGQIRAKSKFLLTNYTGNC